MWSIKAQLATDDDDDDESYIIYIYIYTYNISIYNNLNFLLFNFAALSLIYVGQ